MLEAGETNAGRLHGGMLQRVEGGCNGRWVRRKPDRMGQKGRAGNGESLKNLKQSSTVGGLCFVKTALMLSGEDIWRGKRQTQKTMQIWMRLVKVETEKCTSPRDEVELTHTHRLKVRVRGRKFGTRANFAASTRGEQCLLLRWARLGIKTSPWTCSMCWVLAVRWR